MLNKIKVGLVIAGILLAGFALGNYLSFTLSAILGLVAVLVVGFFLLLQSVKEPEATGDREGNKETNDKLQEKQQSLQRDLEEIEEALNSISRGDLSFQIKLDDSDNEAMKSCEQMLNRLRNLISKIMRSSVILSSASGKWAEATGELNEISGEHAVAVAELVDDNEAVVDSVAEAREVLNRIQKEYVNRGQEIMEIQNRKMDENLQLMQELNKEVSRLNRRTEDISIITETINTLAEETNLLALNASIEAARVGKEGRSFNVIAEEVKDLATDSLDSSQEIMKVVSEVRSGIEEVVGSVEETRESVESQQDTVRRVSTLFDEIVETTTRIEEGLEKIDERTGDSFTKTEQLNKGVQKQTGDVNYIAGQADRLTEVSLDLQGELDEFQFIKLAYTQVEQTSAAVAKEMLEKKLGLGVVLVPLNYAEMYHSIARGILDGMVSSWVPKTHEKYLQQFQGDFEDLGASLEGARIGLVVPEYVEAESIRGLIKNTNFTERKIYAIEATAGVTIAAGQAIEDYGLEGWKVDPVGLDRMMDHIGHAVERGEPIVATGWKPHWMFEKYDLKFLEDPQKTFGTVEEIHTIARPNLKRDNPRVYDMLRQISFDMEEYTAIMWKIQQGEDPEEIAREYVEKHFD